MYMKKLLGSSLKKVLTAVFAVLLLIGSVGFKQVYADDKSVKETGIDINDINYDDFSGDLVWRGDAGVYKKDSGKDLTMTQGKEYKATFDLNYYGTDLVAVATAKLISYKLNDPDGHVWVYIDSEGLLRVEWYLASAIVDWTVELYEADDSTAGYNTSKSYLKYFLVGFFDPDESDYLFNPDGRTIYYDDAESNISEVTQTAAEYFKVATGSSGGFVRPHSACDFDGATFVVSIHDSETKFDFKTDTLNWGGLQVPRLYSVSYNIFYDLNDNDGGSTKAQIEAGNPVKYATSPNNVYVTKDPTRQGYKFLGWKEVYLDEEGNETGVSDDWCTVVPAESQGDKKFRAYWEPIQYNVVYDPNKPSTADENPSGNTDPQPDREFDKEYNLSENGFELEGYVWLGWSDEPGEDPVVFGDKDPYENLTDVPGATVTLYAQWRPIEYVIKYDPNKPVDAPTNPTGDMPDDDHRKYDVQYNLSENKFELEGYDWLGWSLEEGVNPVVYDDEDPYKNLVKEDGGVVTLYAQWEPWKYYIDYDPNGGQGEMPEQTFEYWDEKMESLKNTYTRPGYKFAGFDYYYDGVKYHVDTIDDFEEKLKSLGKESKITLIAQWEKLPDPVVAAYAIPTTGVE